MIPQPPQSILHPPLLTPPRYQNIWGVGRNFKDHADEMKTERPETPLIFLKSGASANQPLPTSQTSALAQLPSWAVEVHHEVEVAVQISAKGQPLQATLALDLTERHFQSLAKKKGLPWTLAKSFQGATLLGPWLNWSPQYLHWPLELFVNGELRQRGIPQDWIFSLDQVTHYLLQHFPVCDGDVILMGTPAGVGPLKDGDRALTRWGDEFQFEWVFQTAATTAAPRTS